MVKYKTNQLDQIFSALSDPTRRNILEHLGKKPQTVTGLSARYDMSLPAVSKHLKILEQAGLLHRTRRGRTHHLSVNAEPLQHALSWVDTHRHLWESSFDRLETYLVQQQTKESS